MLPAPEVGGGAALASAQGLIRISRAQEKRACMASAAGLDINAAATLTTF
jgi:hypothetical protein